MKPMNPAAQAVFNAIDDDSLVKGYGPTDDPNVLTLYLKDGWTILVGCKAICGPGIPEPLIEDTPAKVIV